MTTGHDSGVQLRPIRIGVPGDEIGKKDLVAVARRFQNLHHLQLQRIQEMLSPRQRDLLELLPLLFQINHPLLPGFVSLETPAGIPEYAPSRRTLARAERLSKSFEYRRRALPNYPIWGIYLMGSVGSIAYSKQSDLDIWLCHAPDIEPGPLEELKSKARAVEEWAASLQLEAHIYFINPDQFRAGIGQPISTENCGSIQHHLLLEEFYRTSLYIAGRIPAWWLVPPDQDGNYTAYLRHLNDNRFIGEQELIDFGGLEYVSAEEFLGGTLWQLYKAIGSPHKSMLKLLLMESYASEYPKPNWLCTGLKAAVYRGDIHVHEVDSYLLMYRKVEVYLRDRQEYDRLDLARQCFYLKLNELLSVSTSPTVARRECRDVLKMMTDSWGWGTVRLQELDARRRWRVEQVIEEQKPISRELTNGYRYVSRFAQEYAKQMQIKRDEIALLGHRLFAALEYKPGKVQLLSSDGYEQIADQDFSLHSTKPANGENGWILYADRVNRTDVSDKSSALKRAASLVEILAWLICNGFYQRNRQQILLDAGDTSLTAADLRITLESLEQFIKAHCNAEESLEAYGQPSSVKAAALFLNLGNDPDAGRKDGMQVTSNRFDPLSFGANRINQIVCVDTLAFTSWKEILVTHYRGATGLFECIADLINQGPPAQLHCFSTGSTRSRSIVHRAKGLFHTIGSAFESGEDGMRFIVRGGSDFHVFEKTEGKLKFRNLSDMAGLMDYLTESRERFGPAVFDEIALENSPLPEIYRHNKPGAVQIFCLPSIQHIDLYILDERGSLFYRRHTRCSPQQLFSPYTSFINAIQRHLVTQFENLEYYLLNAEPNGGFAVLPYAFKAEPANRKLNIRIFGLELPDGPTAYSIYCNEHEFSSMDSDQQMFTAVARHIMQLRATGEHYPIYITDVDVPLAVLGADHHEQLQTLLLLKYKQKIEDRLNPTS